MGKGPGEVVGSDPVEASQLDMSGDELEGSPPASAPREDEEIAAARADIEQTREEMSGTIDAIEEKLSPGHLKERATESIKQATVGKATQALDAARRNSKEAARGLSSTAKGAWTRTQSAKLHPMPVAAVGISLAGITIAARLIQVRRQRAEQAPPAKYGTKAGQALNQVQRAVGQIAGQAQSTAIGFTGRKVDRVNQHESEPSDQGRLTGSSLRWLLLDTPLSVVDLIAGLGLVASLVILRRGRRTT